MKKKSIYDFDFTSNMISSIFSNIVFLFVKKKRTVKKATVNTLISFDVRNVTVFGKIRHNFVRSFFRSSEFGPTLICLLR